jgi:hypothetical protein
MRDNIYRDMLVFNFTRIISYPEKFLIVLLIPLGSRFHHILKHARKFSFQAPTCLWSNAL